MKHREQTMQPFITEHLKEIEELCRKHHVRRLSIFGSAVRDDFDPATSDVDVRVEFDKDELIQHPADNYFDLLDSLTALFGRRVDLMSARRIANPYLRDAIEKSQVTLYAA